MATKDGWRFPLTTGEDDRVWNVLTRDVLVNAQLPDWPFSRRDGLVRFCSWEDVMSGDFGQTFRALCETHGDTQMLIATFAVGGRRTLLGGGQLPVIEFDASGLDDENYWQAIESDPGPHYAIPLWPGADIVAATGSTGGWSLWAEADWEIGVVRTSVPLSDVDQSATGDMFVSLDTAIDVYLAQALRTDHVPDAIRSALTTNFTSVDEH